MTKMEERASIHQMCQISTEAMITSNMATQKLIRVAWAEKGCQNIVQPGAPSLVESHHAIPSVIGKSN